MTKMELVEIVTNAKISANYGNINYAFINNLLIYNYSKDDYTCTECFES